MAGFFLLALLAVSQSGSRERCGRALALVSYVAGDYATAVGPRGEMFSAEELREQVQFAAEAALELRSCGAPDLASRLDGLRGRIEARGAPPEIIREAETIAAAIAQRFHLDVLPAAAPDVRRGRTLYRQACAACHGADGNPPPPERLPLPTRPTAFASKSEVARLSPRRILAAATYGVPSTAMPSFGEALSEGELWDLSFYALTFAHADETERSRGAELLRVAPRVPDYLQLAIRSDEQLRAALRGSGLSATDQEAVVSAVRTIALSQGPIRKPTPPRRAGSR